MGVTLKIYSYNADGDKVATKTFTEVPSNYASDPQALTKFINKYAALTSADTTKAEIVTTTPVDLAA